MRLRVGKVLFAAIVIAISLLLSVSSAAADSDADAMDGLLLYEVDSYGKGVAVHNYGSSSIDMRDYTIADMPSLIGGEGTITFSSSLMVPAGSTLVLVKTYDAYSAFCTQDGAACYSWGDNTAGISASSRFSLSNTKDDVYLFKGDKIIDAMCYGSATISDASIWSGSSVGVCKNGWMMRIGNDDTNTSTDWRAYIPGQTTYTFDPTLQYDATVTPFTFPESGGVPVYKAVSDATESIRIEVYMLQSRNMMGLLAEKASQGVDVDILMEGNPFGYKSSLESAAPYYRYLVDKGVEIRFIDVGDVDRYSYDHAKFAVIDGDSVVVTSENWVTDNLNGTIRETSYTSTSEGNRGWGAIIESDGYASFMNSVFENDWSTDYGDVKTFTELYPNARSSTPYYIQPASWGSFPSYSAKVTPVLSNDSSYAALEYYTSNATKRLYCEQQSLGYGVGEGPLKMLADAASRGVDTRLVVGTNATDDATVETINSDTGISAAVMKAPYVHNKGVIADDTVWVSSINWTLTSFFNNRECCAVITSPEVADYFAYYFTKDFQQYYDYNGFTASITGLDSEYDSGEEIIAIVTVVPEGDYTYTWDFGDGSASKTTYIPRTTATPAVGTHTLTVTVSDSEGRSSTVQQEYTVDGTIVYPEGVSAALSSDTVLSSGTSMIIRGSLVVPAGTTLTISAGSSVSVSGSLDILGDLVIEGSEEESLSDGSLLAADGSVTVRGIAEVSGAIGSTGTGAISVIDGGYLGVSSAGTVYGNVSVGTASSVFVSGSFGSLQEGPSHDVSFSVDGILTMDSDAVSHGFSVGLGESGTLSLDRILLLDGARVSVSDAGLRIWDSTDSSMVSDLGKTDTVLITGSASSPTPIGDDWSFGSVVEGLRLSASTVSKEITSGYSTRAYYNGGYDSGQHLRTTTLSLSGSVTVYPFEQYSGSLDSPYAIIDRGSPVSVSVTGSSGISIDDALSLRGNVLLTLDGTVTVSALVKLVYAVSGDDASVPVLAFGSGCTVVVRSSIDASTGIPGSNMIRSEAQRISISADGSISAPDAIGGDASSYNLAYYTTSSSAVMHHYVSVDSALAAMLSGDTRGVSVYGAQFLRQSASVPSGSSLTLMDGSRLYIGVSSEDIVLTVPYGASLKEETAGTASIHVFGTLYSERRSSIPSSLRDSISSQVIVYQTDSSGVMVSNGWVKWMGLGSALSSAVSGDTVPLYSDVSIYTDMTVPDGVTLSANGHTIAVRSGATLKVEGILDLTADGSAVVLDAADSSSSGGTVSYSGYLVYMGALPISVSDGTQAHSSGAYFSIGDTKYLTSAWNAASHINEADGRYVYIEGDSNGDVRLGDISFSGIESDSAVVLVHGNIVTGNVELDHAILAVYAGYRVDATFYHGTDSVVVDAALVESVSDSSGLAFYVSHNTTYDVDCMRFTGTFADEQDDGSAITLSGNVWIVGTTEFGGAEVSVIGDLAVGLADDPDDCIVIADSLYVYGTVYVFDGARFGSDELYVFGSVLVGNGSILAASVAAVAGSVDVTADDASFRSTAVLLGFVQGASLKGAVDFTRFMLVAPTAVLSLSNVSDYRSTVLHMGGSVYATAYAPADSASRISDMSILDGFSGVSVPAGAELEGWESSDGVTAVDEAIGAWTDAYAVLSSGSVDVTFVYGVTVEVVQVQKGSHPVAPSGSVRSGYATLWYIDGESVDLGSYEVSGPVVIVASYVPVSTGGEVLAALHVSTSGTVTLLLVSSDDSPIASGKVSVSYTYTSVRNMFGVQVTGSANGTFQTEYVSTGEAYAHIVLDFETGAGANYSKVTGASAAFDDGTVKARTSSMVLSLPARD